MQEEREAQLPHSHGWLISESELGQAGRPHAESVNPFRSRLIIQFNTALISTITIPTTDPCVICFAVVYSVLRPPHVFFQSFGVVSILFSS